MCLYERKLRNPYYMVSEKNKGNIPECEDERQLHMTTGCGWCKECRKELASSWNVRLKEELKSNTNVRFVTMSFSPKAIRELEQQIHRKGWRGYKGETTDVNDLATYAVRMWSERWRKKYKHAPRHWLITELGHKNSERIHLHGLVWNTGEESRYGDFNNAITKTWNYGNVWNGNWVDTRTINYITKYVTKLDNHHKGYKQKILTSQKMGADYIWRQSYTHKWAYDKTVTYYTDEKGYRHKLPRYWKNKLFTEDQRRKLWTYELDKQKLKIGAYTFDLNRQDEEDQRKLMIGALQGERDSNILAGYGDQKTTAYRWIITEAMKMETTELLNYDKSKIVQKEERREIEDVIYIDERNNSLGKHIDCEHLVLGEYTGTTTASQRKYNRELKEARRLHMSVRTYRLHMKGII